MINDTQLTKNEIFDYKDGTFQIIENRGRNQEKIY